MRKIKRGGLLLVLAYLVLSLIALAVSITLAMRW